MKLLIPFLAAIALLTNCTRPIPPQSTPTKTEHAANLTFMPGYVQAEFENGASAAIYFAGGASICVPGQCQIEIEGKMLPDVDGSYLCANSENGDYLQFFPSGFATAKVEGIVWRFMPRKSGTVFAQ